VNTVPERVSICDTCKREHKPQDTWTHSQHTQAWGSGVRRTEERRTFWLGVVVLLMCRSPQRDVFQSFEELLLLSELINVVAHAGSPTLNDGMC